MVTRRFGGNDIRVTIEGVEGPPGKSAYESWLEQGNTGTEQDFLASVAEDAAELVPPPPPDEGGAGLSAYQVAVLNGFLGTEAQWLASLVGPQGPPGADSTVPGPPGADSTVPGPPGPVGLTWRGTWDNATSYVKDDAVELNGQSYIALQGSTNNNPESSPTKWQLLAAKGATGQTGSAGTPGVGVPTGGTTGQVLAKSSNADFATAWTTPAAGGGGPSNVKLTADAAAFTATALANVTGLSFAVTSGVLYRFTFYLVFRTAALTTGARFGLTTPAFTVYAGQARIPFAADGSDSEFVGTLNTSGDSVMSTAVATANSDQLAILEGVILPSANGTLQVQAATEVASSALTVRNGSHGQLWTIT